MCFLCVGAFFVDQPKGNAPETNRGSSSRRGAECLNCERASKAVEMENAAAFDRTFSILFQPVFRNIYLCWPGRAMRMDVSLIYADDYSIIIVSKEILHTARVHCFHGFLRFLCRISVARRRSHSGRDLCRSSRDCSMAISVTHVFSVSAASRSLPSVTIFYFILLSNHGPVPMPSLMEAIAIFFHSFFSRPPFFPTCSRAFAYGQLASVHADSFRPIANPNVGHRSTAKRIPITAAPRTTTIAATFRPLTTISATLKAQKPTAKSRPLPAITTAQPTGKAKDSAKSDSKDAPVAEAWYADFNHLRRRRRPYFGNKYFLNTPFNAPFGFGSSRPRRRPLPRPYFPQPAYFGYNSPYEDYRFETDFLDPSATYSGSRPTKPKVPIDSGSIGEYGGGGGGGGSDGEITQYYDPSSATFHVGSGYKSHDGSSSGGSGYYSSGKGSSSLGSSGAGSSSLGGAGTGTGVAYEYTTDSDDGYKFTSKPKGKGTRSPTKSKTRYRFNTYTPDTDSGYKYSSGGDTSGYGTSASGGGGGGDQLLDIDDTSSTDPDPYSQSKYLYPTKNVVYQTAPKASKPKAVKSTTYTPPIKISDSSIDILTKPLGSATFNLNLSPGTVYQPPAISYNPIGSAYKPIQAIQPIPIQPPATSYGKFLRTNKDSRAIFLDLPRFVASFTVTNCLAILSNYDFIAFNLLHHSTNTHIILDSSSFTLTRPLAPIHPHLPHIHHRIANSHLPLDFSSSLFVQRCSNWSAPKYLLVSKPIPTTTKRLPGQRTIKLSNARRTRAGQRRLRGPVRRAAVAGPTAAVRDGRQLQQQSAVVVRRDAQVAAHETPPKPRQSKFQTRYAQTTGHYFAKCRRRIER